MVSPSAKKQHNQHHLPASALDLFPSGGRKSQEKKRQEISAILKYFVFLLNFVFFLCGLVCIALGTYLHVSDFRPVMEALDFVVNPNVLLIIAGSLIFGISFLGCTGALRENICLLKLFGLSLFLSYITLVILAFVIFILFYSNSDTGVSIQSLLLNAIRKYRESKNMEFLIDSLQIALDCCGATISQGYKDWDQSPFFNCSASNSPDRCGVPYSCCKSAQRMASCGFFAQEKSVTELQEKINTEGCVSKLQKAFESYAVIVGAVIGAIIVPVCLSITLSNILANQIDRQRYILHRQTRREERWRRRMRRRFRDPLVPAAATATVECQNETADNTVNNNGEAQVVPVPRGVVTDPSSGAKHRSGHTRRTKQPGNDKNEASGGPAANQPRHKSSAQSAGGGHQRRRKSKNKDKAKKIMQHRSCSVDELERSRKRSKQPQSNKEVHRRHGSEDALCVPRVSKSSTTAKLDTTTEIPHIQPPPQTDSRRQHKLRKGQSHDFSATDDWLKSINNSNAVGNAGADGHNTSPSSNEQSLEKQFPVEQTK